MADAATIRAWAKSEELEVNARGAIPEHIIAAYDDAHPEVSEDAGVTEADFPPAPPGPDGPDDPFVGETGAPPKAPRSRARERKPRAVKPPRQNWKAMFGGGGTKTARAKGPRTDLSEFAEETWRDMAMLTAGIMPPVSRVLTIQAPYAGVTFDAAVKNLPIVDSVLQPVAKYSVSMRALNGLVGPAFFTAALTMSGEWVTTEDGMPVITPDGRPVPTARTAALLGGLKYSLLQMSRVADLEKVQERAEADAERMRAVDRLVDFIMGFPAAQAPAPAPGEGPAPAPSPGSPSPSAAPGQVLVPTFIYPPPPQMDDVGAPA